MYQTRSNAIILQGTVPAYCIPKVVRTETGGVVCEKVYASLRLPPKISLRHEWTKEFGSKIVQQPEGEVVRQTKFFQSTQLTPSPLRDRSGRLDDMQDGRSTSRSQEMNVNSFFTKNSVLQTRFMSMFVSCGSRDIKKRMRVKCQSCFSISKKIWNGTIVNYWSWF